MFTRSDLAILCRRSLVRIWLLGLLLIAGVAHAAPQVYIAAVTKDYALLGDKDILLTLGGVLSLLITLCIVVLKAARDFARRKSPRTVFVPAPHTEHTHPDLASQETVTELQHDVVKIAEDLDDMISRLRFLEKEHHVVSGELAQIRREAEGIRTDMRVGQQNSIGKIDELKSLLLASKDERDALNQRVDKLIAAVVNASSGRRELIPPPALKD